MSSSPAPAVRPARTGPANSPANRPVRVSEQGNEVRCERPQRRHFRAVLLQQVRDDARHLGVESGILCGLVRWLG
jgi:hypothetical protein